MLNKELENAGFTKINLEFPCKKCKFIIKREFTLPPPDSNPKEETIVCEKCKLKYTLKMVVSPTVINVSIEGLDDGDKFEVEAQ